MKKVFIIFLIFIIGCGQSGNSSDSIISLISLSKFNFISNTYISNSDLVIYLNLTKNQVIFNLKNCENGLFEGQISLPQNDGEIKQYVVETNTFNSCYGNSVEYSVEKTMEMISNKNIFLVNIFGEKYKMYQY